jgi:hypothetical protein
VDFTPVPRDAFYNSPTPLQKLNPSALISVYKAPEKVFAFYRGEPFEHRQGILRFWIYTRNGRRRCKTTLKTSGEDVKLHSKRVEKT